MTMSQPLRAAAEPTVAALIGELVRTHQTQHRLVFEMAGETLVVETNSDTVAEALRSYHPELLREDEPSSEGRAQRILAVDAPVPRPSVSWQIKPPDPGKDKAKEARADLADGRLIHKLQRDLIVMLGRERAAVVGSVGKHAEQVINLLNHRVNQRHLERGYLLGHAAGVVRGDRAVAIAGFAGMGKSTLALHAMHRYDELSLLSNDRIVLQNGGVADPRVYGVARHPRVNPGTLLHNPSLVELLPDAERERYLELPSSELRTVERKFDVMIHRHFGPGRFRLSAQLAALVVLNWKPGAGEARPVRVDPGERLDLMQAVRKDTGLFFLPPGYPHRASGRSEAPSYAEALAEVPVYELRGGFDEDTGIRLVRSLLG